MSRAIAILMFALAAFGQPNSFWVRPQSYTVATLPTAGVANRTVYVTNAATNASCLVGGGSVVLLCRDTGSTWAPAGDGSTAGGAAVHYSGSSVLDLPSIPDGTCHLATTAITVTNAAAGHRTVVGTSASFPEGISVTAVVTGPNSMKVQLCNMTGSAYDPASVTYTLGVVL